MLHAVQRAVWHIVAQQDNVIHSPQHGVRHLQAFINKHDYARLHSYEFHSYPVARNKSAPGTWYRLELIKQVIGL